MQEAIGWSYAHGTQMTPNYNIQFDDAIDMVFLLAKVNKIVYGPIRII